ncbi:unnamed protein product [Euphydryas editha]|uniref:Uncharacterized protein n=1 Tax=Euphydryas editha TaxID=104508 RepID=A0AAU9U9I6_EUPED|nr:unnamed protein product [Euphydryas editha]
MATLGCTSGKLLRKVHILPVLSRNFSAVKPNKINNYVWKTCACAIGGGILLYAANIKNRGTVYALKAKSAIKGYSLQVIGILQGLLREKFYIYHPQWSGIVD